MALTLKIENETSLPDGGPLSVSVQGQRGIDIGRDQYLDWTLPDPTRTVSGRHCEVRWHDGAYWLHDISTNGTYLYGTNNRLKEPYRLRNGDRFSIGHYIIVATVEDEGGPAYQSAPATSSAPNYDELWNPVGETAPPIDAKLLKSARDHQPVKPDFLQWAVDVPTASSEPRYAPPPPAAPPEDAWARATPKPPPPEPEVIPVPTPRRPVWVAEQPNSPWAGSAAAASPAPAPDPAPQAREEAPPREIRKAPPAVREAGSLDEFIRLMARSSGMPEEAMAARDPSELAQELGQLLRLVTENTRQLLDARQQAKRLARSSNQTTIQALDNNPLKFAPTPEDALRIMFGPPTRSYLDARRAFTQSFGDLKSHQVKFVSAMQQALRRLLADFDPDAIDRTSKEDSGLASMLGSRKARLWDIYSARWRALKQNNEDGLLNAFMIYFADYYDSDGKDRP